MSGYLSFVQSGSTARHPDKPWYPELDGLLLANPVFLCQLLTGGAESYGISVRLQARHVICSAVHHTGASLTLN